MEVFTSKADEVKKILKETPPDQLQDSVLTFLSYMSAFLTAFVEHNGAEGWSAFVMNERGSILDSSQQKKMEKSLAACPWLLPYLKGDTSYKGGGQADAEDAEMEENLRYLLQMINDGKAQIKQLGLVKLIHSDIPIPPNPYMPMGLNIPLAPFFMGLMALIDLFRYNRARLGNKNMLLTLLVFIEEILTEQWHQALLTSLGFFSATGVSMGIVAKYILNVFLLAQPAQERGKFVQASVSMGKSFITGTLAWVLETFTSQSIKDKLSMYADAGKGFSFIDIHNKLKDKVSEIVDPAKMCTLYAPVVTALNGTKMQPIFLAMLSLFGFPPANEVMSVCSGSSPLATTVASPLPTTVAPASQLASPQVTTVASPQVTTVAPPLATTVAPPLATTVAPPLATTVAPPLATTVASPQVTTVASPQVTTVASPQVTTDASPQVTTDASPQVTTVAPPSPLKGGKKYKKTRSKKRKAKRPTRSRRPLSRAAT